LSVWTAYLFGFEMAIEGIIFYWGNWTFEYIYLVTEYSVMTGRIIYFWGMPIYFFASNYMYTPITTS